MGEKWSQTSTVITSFMFIYTVVRQFIPSELRSYLSKYTRKIFSLVYPYIHITFDEYSGDSFNRSQLYVAIETYLGANSTTQAKRLKAHDIKSSKTPLSLGLDDNTEVTDEFQGVKLFWASRKLKEATNTPGRYWSYPNSDEKRHYRLTFHRRHLDLITTSYLNHVVEEGKGIAVMNRKRKLYTNGAAERRNRWVHIEFEHPASFNTLAMDPKRKQEIIEGLLKFKKGKEYYAKVGKPWKRGYLLYGPPGTGKSTLIAAMANFLGYDIYDLELTSVTDNSDLRKLLIDISNKSIVVIEDIDCSLDLTGQRKKSEKEKDEDGEKNKGGPKKKAKEEDKKSKVTLSGLLNFVDGIWSACGGERLIVFTTNYVDKLDPALTRRGRMDEHIELSYCRFEAFKVLAKNYLDVESHDLFSKIERLLGETDMTPADVAENLMPKSDTEYKDECLQSLVEALECAKKDAVRKKAEEEAKLKTDQEEEEEKLKNAKKKKNWRNRVKEILLIKKEVKSSGALKKTLKEPKGSVITN
ncbi:Spastin [Parasponia andersonii]|uniref:Spastin n=1 Tax=Parasponia andersonii TaxID=3476 RepID=A0A2P5CJ49_PARAD|nr:Spastin [Parasponia andersonii]